MQAIVLTGALMAFAAVAFAGSDEVEPHQDGQSVEHKGHVVGAIRWDAWTGGSISEIMERTLGPGQYHFRLPWFAEVLGENKVRIAGGLQAVMDQEIEWAAAAGLNYWAFLTYPRLSPMSVALDQYLKSEKRNRLNFCLILHNTLKVKAEDWPAERDRTVKLLQEQGYQTVLDGRPLVFAFMGDKFPFDRFAELREAVAKAGLNPYYVWMGWHPAADYPKVSKQGFDAVSNYAKGGDQPRFSDLVGQVEQTYWKKAAGAKVPYIPLVTTGWDKRPRQTNEVPWEKDASYHSQKVFPSMAAPGEIAGHLRRALAFVDDNPGVCKARAVIIYAWNEYDEGGWLAPTRGADGKPDTARLDAIAEVLNPKEKTAQPASACDTETKDSAKDVK